MVEGQPRVKRDGGLLRAVLGFADCCGTSTAELHGIGQPERTDHA